MPQGLLPKSVRFTSYIHHGPERTSGDLKTLLSYTFRVWFHHNSCQSQFAAQRKHLFLLLCRTYNIESNIVTLNCFFSEQIHCFPLLGLSLVSALEWPETSLINAECCPIIYIFLIHERKELGPKRSERFHICSDICNNRKHMNQVKVTLNNDGLPARVTVGFAATWIGSVTPNASNTRPQQAQQLDATTGVCKVATRS